MFFDDGVRNIDYILAWEVPKKKASAMYISILNMRYQNLS